jgi:predicted Zn-dependent protease
MNAVNAALLSLALVAGCGEIVSSPSEPAAQPRTVRLSAAQAQRLQRVMTPLLAAADKPMSPRDVSIALIEDPSINAANAGSKRFYITTGLLEKANDEQLRGVLAHEIAHDDLGHVAKAQVLGAGLNIGVVLLEQLIPGSSALTPIAGTLIAQGYSRQEEYAADRHGVEILQRAGYPPQTMTRTLQWIMREEGSAASGGGFFSSHPGTEDRIAALQKITG